MIKADKKMYHINFSVLVNVPFISSIILQENVYSSSLNLNPDVLCSL